MNLLFSHLLLSLLFLFSLTAWWQDRMLPKLLVRASEHAEFERGLRQPSYHNHVQSD